MRRLLRYVLGIVGAALLLVLLLTWALEREPLPPSRPRDAGVAKRKPAPKPRPRTEPRTPPPIEVDVEGPTKFVRRLRAGDHLVALRKLSPSARVNEALSKLRPHLLHMDRFDKFTGDTSAALVYLTEPRRDSQALKVEQRAKVRVWTLDGKFPRDPLSAASWALRLWRDLAKAPDWGGFDVVATPALGREVFPDQPDLTWAIGVYFHPDDYCAVRSTLTGESLRRTLQHELAHALVLRLSPAFTQSRCIDEGIASYLEQSHGSDGGLRVDVDRLRHEFAALDAMLTRLEKRGVKFPENLLQRVIRLDPVLFYTLGHFGYLLGLAGVAYEGGERVTDALKARSDRQLRLALEDLAWSDLRAFVRREASGGDATQAWLVAERAVTADKADLKRALTRVGIKRSLKLAELRVPQPAPFDEAVRSAVVKELFDEEAAAPVIVAELSERMDEPWNDTTPREYVARMWESLGGADRTLLLPLCSKLAGANDLQLLVPHPGVRIPLWMGRKGSYDLGRFILCTASGPYLTEKQVQPYWQRLLRDKGAKRAVERFKRGHPDGPAYALVIDLGKQPTEYAVWWTYVLAAASDFRGHVAYWRPG